MMEVKIFTLYPDLFPGPLSTGIYKKAMENKIWKLKVINIRDYSIERDAYETGCCRICFR
jgi:tRNA (guanine37-N1)-methyltransferase